MERMLSRRGKVLQVKNIYKFWGKENEKIEILKEISITVSQGEFVGVMGPSGSGKTTLLNCIANYIPYEGGSIILGNQDLTNLNENDIAMVRNKKMGFIFQDFMLLDGLTVLDNIMLPRIIANQIDSKMETDAVNLCKMFHINHIKNKYPANISGGEKQRTAVARALINEPLILLADEPTGNLDSKSGKDVINAFLQAQRNLSTTIFMVTHDSYAASFCDRVILLKDGVVFDIIKRYKDRQSFYEELLVNVKRMNGDIYEDI